jgi:hypothetical protein
MAAPRAAALDAPEVVDASGVGVLASAFSTTDTFVAMRALLVGLAFGVSFALPWIAAAAWIGWRVGWRAVFSENGEAFPTQATSLRSFSLR